MRIPNTAEVLTFFAAIGQFSNLQSVQVDSELSLAPADADYASADSEFSLIPAGAVDGADLDYPLAAGCGRLYTVKSGDNCNAIGAKYGAPTYQIMCQNDAINNKCSNLATGQNICLGRHKEDCGEVGIVKGTGNVQFIAKQFNVPVEVFKDNNYCYNAGQGRGRVCPPFYDGLVVCTAKTRVKAPVKCAKIFKLN